MSCLNELKKTPVNHRSYHCYSLAASKDPKYPWVAAVTELNGLMKLYIIDWKASSLYASNEVGHKTECQNTSSYIFHIDEL